MKLGLSLVYQVSLFQGCPLTGVPLYSIFECMYGGACLAEQSL